MGREGGAAETSVLGAILGVGAIVGVTVLLSRSSRAIGSIPGPRGPFSSTEVPRAGRVRFSPLVERWRGEVTRRSQGLPVPALLEWIRIESGGDMCSTGTPYEVGIFQLMFPADAKYGATLEGLRAICRKSQQHDPSNITWLSEEELNMEVGAGIRKILAARDDVRRVLGESRIFWPETSLDFGSAVKQIHAAPAVITELVPKLSRQGGAPASWSELRQRVMTFPVEQMGGGLRRLANAPSKRGLKNRLEDTLQNAETVGRAWAAAYA